MSRDRNVFDLFGGESDEDIIDYNSDLDPEFTPQRPRRGQRSNSSSSQSSDDSNRPGPSKKRRKSTKPSASRPKPTRSRAVVDGDEVFYMDGSDVEEWPAVPDSSNISTSPTDESRPPTPDQSQADDDSTVTAADWSQDLTGFPDIPEFTGEPGLHCDRDVYSELSCFRLFIDDFLITYIKEQTNKYAAEVKAANQDKVNREGHNICKDWVTVTKKEIKGFLLILLHMGVVKKPFISDYWSLDVFISTPFAAMILSRDRFKAILSMLHTSNNDNYVPPGQPGHDPLHKVRPVYEHLQDKFQQVYTPQKNIAIDEAMCSWRGRLRFKVYLKDKPNPWGIKFYELCESGSGYVYRFEIYAGEAHVSNKPTDVVLRLMEPLLDKGYHIFTDNYYTCPDLYNTLTTKSTMCTGTVRGNRKGMPKDLVLEKLSKGQISFRRKGNLSAVKWSDKRDVIILTSAHTPTDTIMHTSRNTVNPTEKPVCVNDYTKSMCAVDHSDQFLSYLPLARRTLKWSKKVFMHLLTLSVVQAMIVFNKLQRENGKKTLPLPLFIRALGKQLTEEYQAERGTTTPRTPAKTPKTLLRLNHTHFHHLVSLPPTLSKSKPRRECKVCKDIAASQNPSGKTPRVKDVHFWCKVCEVPLCVEPCFFKFHNSQNYIAA